jgi:hypothetical protein
MLPLRLTNPHANVGTLHLATLPGAGSWCGGRVFSCKANSLAAQCAPSQYFDDNNEGAATQVLCATAKVSVARRVRHTCMRAINETGRNHCPTLRKSMVITAPLTTYATCHL